MGAGVALALRKKYPEVFEVDKKTADKNRNTLGEISVVDLDGKMVINLYQQSLTPDPVSLVMLNYNALYSALELMKNFIINLSLENIESLFHI